MEKLTIESVPAFVQWWPRTQAALDAEVAEAQRKFAKPGFGLTLGPYHAAIAARKGCNMPLSVELYLVSMRADHDGFQPHGSAAPPIGAAPRAVALRTMTDEQARKSLSPGEFAEYTASKGKV